MTIPTLISFHAIGLLTVALTTTAVGQTPEEKNIPQQVNEAIDRGVFGVPAMFVGDEMVWGQDRLHFVETLLRGETL